MKDEEHLNAAGVMSDAIDIVGRKKYKAITLKVRGFNVNEMVLYITELLNAAEAIAGGNAVVTKADPKTGKPLEIRLQEYGDTSLH